MSAPIRKDNLGVEAVISSGKPNLKSNTQKNKKNIKKAREVNRKSESSIVVGIISTLTAGQDNPVNKLTSDLVGASFTVTNPHTLVDTNEYPTSRYTLPTSYSTSISKVKNDKSFILSEPYSITDTNTNDKIPVKLKKGSVSITYDTFQTITENTIYNRSYANMTIGNLRTFSGDVYKAKIYTREHGTSTDYEEIYENYVVPENQLVDTTSITGYDDIGFFHTASIVSNNWVSSSTITQTNPFVALNNEKLIDGLEISGSVTGLNEIVEFSTKNHNTLEKGVDYVVRFNTYYFKSVSERKNEQDKISNEKYASLKVYLSGSAISGTDEDDFFLGEVDIPDNAADEGEILNVVSQFRSAESGSPRTHLKFELHSGKFIIQDVSIEPFSEVNYNPSFFNVLAPMPKPVRRGDKYDFLVEFYDSNNNLAETSTETLGVVFEGPRQIIADGLDARLTGSMVVGESIELYGTNPAYIKSVGYQGFAHTVANNKGGFLLYSGSIGNGAPENRLTASEAYQGVGLEIVDAHGAGTGGDRYLKFKTNAADEDSEFEIVTDTFLFGLSGSTNNYISGSNGKLEISSSNFELNGATGNVTLQGIITAEAGGTIGGFTVSSSALAGENIFISGSPVAGGTDDSKNMFISTSKFNVKENGDVTGSAVLFDGGKVGGFDIVSDGISSVNNAFQVTGSNGVISGSNVLFTGGKIANWDIIGNTLSSIDSDNRGLVFNSNTPSLLIQSQSNGAIHGEVRITANPQGGIANQKAASIIVSQSQIPIFSVGGDDFIFTSRFNAIMGSVPIQKEEQFSENENFGGITFPAFEEQTFENSSDTNTNTAGGGAPTVKVSNLVVGSSLSASRFTAGNNIFLRNTGVSSSRDTKFHVLIDDEAASGSSEPAVNINFDVRKHFADGKSFNTDEIRQSMGFSTILSSADADTRFISNGNTTGSAIYHYFTRLEETANNKWADGKFAMMRLDVDTADLQQVEHRKEFVFLEMRESTGSAANTANDTNGRPNKRVFQVQASGSVVAAGNITAFGTTFMNVSDERLKENIYDVSGSLNKILDLRPTHFTWKENKKQDVGFIAQEVEEIIPEVVETSQGFIDTDGEENNNIQDMKTISYPKLVPYLVDTIQELTERIKHLEKKVK